MCSICREFVFEIFISRLYVFTFKGFEIPSPLSDTVKKKGIYYQKNRWDPEQS